MYYNSITTIDYLRITPFMGIRVLPLLTTGVILYGILQLDNRSPMGVLQDSILDLRVLT